VVRTKHIVQTVILVHREWVYCVVFEQNSIAIAGSLVLFVFIILVIEIPFVGRLEGYLIFIVVRVLACDMLDHSS